MIRVFLRLRILRRGSCSVSPGPSRRRLGCPSPGLLPLVAHELGPERALGLVLVMRPAAQAHAIHRGLAAARELERMIELEPLPRRAPMARLAHEDGMKRLTPTVSW